MLYLTHDKPRHQSDHITTRQYTRLLKTWLVEIGLDLYEYATHSIQRTKVSLIYQKTRNIRAIQLLLGHSILESTARYPGVELDDALDVAENTVVDYREIIKHLFFNRCLIISAISIICTATINLVHCENPSVRAAIHSYLVFDKSTPNRALYDNHGDLTNPLLKHDPYIFRLAAYSLAIT